MKSTSPIGCHWTQGCQRVNSQITRTRIALTRAHTDHLQRVIWFPWVSRIKSPIVYESLSLNCHSPFISDIALTPAARPLHAALPLIIAHQSALTSTSPVASLSFLVLPVYYKLVKDHLRLYYIPSSVASQPTRHTLFL